VPFIRRTKRNSRLLQFDQRAVKEQSWGLLQYPEMTNQAKIVNNKLAIIACLLLAVIQLCQSQCTS